MRMESDVVPFRMPKTSWHYIKYYVLGNDAVFFLLYSTPVLRAPKRRVYEPSVLKNKRRWSSRILTTWVTEFPPIKIISITPSGPHSLIIIITRCLASPSLARLWNQSSRGGEGRRERERVREWESERARA